MTVIAQATRYVTGTPAGAGDPSPNTSYGVWWGLRAVAERLFGEPSLSGKHVAVQGVGKVGAGLARLLAEEGARLTLSDIDDSAVALLAKELDASVVPADEVLGAECDVLSPCALGPVVTDKTIEGFRCKAIAGAANNQLERTDHGSALAKRNIVYAPDYVINAGGVINVAGEIMGFGHDEARKRAEGIADTLRIVFERAEKNATASSDEADRLAQERIASVKRTYKGPGGSR